VFWEQFLHIQLSIYIIFQRTEQARKTESPLEHTECVNY